MITWQEFRRRRVSEPDSLQSSQQLKPELSGPGLLPCKTWLRFHSETESDSCCPASSNVSSSGKTNKEQLTQTNPIQDGDDLFCIMSSCVHGWLCADPLIGYWQDSSLMVPHQVVAAGVVDHPALFHHRGAFPLGVFDGLNQTHQRDVTAGGRAECKHTQNQFILLLQKEPQSN